MTVRGSIATKSTPPPQRGTNAEGFLVLGLLLVGVFLPSLVAVWCRVAPDDLRGLGIDGHSILFVMMCGVFTTLATLLSVGAGRAGAQTHNPSETTT